jgi:hypothetical protein
MTVTVIFQAGPTTVAPTITPTTAVPTTVHATTTVPGGQVITIVGGPNATADIPGTHSDPADFYGVILALIAIFAAIVIARWLFGRGGGHRPGAGPTG